MSVVLTVGPPTGVPATDTAAIQSQLDAAETAGGGDVLLSPGTYVHEGLDIGTKVRLRGQGRATVLQSAPDIGRTAIRTKDFATLTGTDTATAGVPHDFAIRDLVQDGDRANQASRSDGVQIYGYAFDVDGLVIRNNKGQALYTEHATQSVATGEENAMVSTLNKFMAHTNDLEGWEFRGPHDMQTGDEVYFFQNNMTNAGSKSQLYVPDSSGRANGAQFGCFHAWGGYSDYGVIIRSSGVRLHSPVIEGGIVAQLWMDIDQIQVYDAHLYTGGVNTAVAKGVVYGHSGGRANGTVFTGRIENCGGGAFDFNYIGDHNVIDADHYYYTSVTPTLAALGWVGSSLGPNNGAKNDIRLRVNDNSFVPTRQSLKQQVGPLKVFRTVSSDTRGLLTLLDEAGNSLTSFDNRARLLAKASGTTSFAAGTGAGTGASVSVSSTSNDMSGTITVTTGTSPATGDAALCAITFAAAFGTTPNVILTPANAAARALANQGANAATGNWTLYVVNPPASTTLKYSYLVIG